MMLGQQPSEYYEYGIIGGGYAEYGAEHGHNEFRPSGRGRHQPKHAGLNRAAIEQDMSRKLREPFNKTMVPYWPDTDPTPEQMDLAAWLILLKDPAHYDTITAALGIPA